MTYTTIDYFLLIFFVFGLSLEEDLVFGDCLLTIFCLLNSLLIFSASLVSIYLVLSLIFDFIKLIIFSSYNEPFKL